MTEELNPNYIKSRLSYNPETGEFVWRFWDDDPVNWNKRFAGKVAGSFSTSGHRQIAINGCLYGAHRLAWVISYGVWPPKFICIDHINGDPSDNRLINLRLATITENMRNTGNYKSNTSGIKGVSFINRDQKWSADIRVNKRLIALGRFDNIEEARSAREAAEIKYFGEFRRVS